MTSEERHEARYQRRRAARLARNQARINEVGGLEEALPFHAMFLYGRATCAGVRWKTSTINFELRLFSRTARNRMAVKHGHWRPKPGTPFTLTERGKRRDIKAPRIDDRQVHKTVCREVLRPLYGPHMIYDSGASLPDKGFGFMMKRLTDFYCWWYRRYGREGYVVTTDFKSYFPSAPHSTIEDKYRRFIGTPALVDLNRKILNADGPIGVALGVETSQTDAGILPERFDHTLKDVFALHCVERYMDDTIFFVHTKEQAKIILDRLEDVCRAEGLTMNRRKTHINKMSGWTTFCKWRWHLSESGRVIRRPGRKCITVERRKLTAFRKMLDAGKITLAEIVQQYRCHIDQMCKGCGHNALLVTNRKFHRLFGIWPTRKGPITV